GPRWPISQALADVFPPFWPGRPPSSAYRLGREQARPPARREREVLSPARLVRHVPLDKLVRPDLEARRAVGGAQRVVDPRVRELGEPEPRRVGPVVEDALVEQRDELPA